jgi:plasmid maintenance system antidote protein VapI
MPPPKKPAQAGPPSLSETIRREILARGLTGYAVAQAAQVDPSSVGRFLRRERTITLEVAERIAAALGLEVRAGRGGLR